MRDLTCEQVTKMARLQKLGRLKPMTPFVSYFDQYDDIVIYEAVRALYKAYSLEHKSLVARLMTQLLNSNPIYARLQSEKKVDSIIKSNPILKKFKSKKHEFKERECYSNAWQMVLYGMADNLIVGTATLPVYYSNHGLKRYTFMHAVAERDGIIFDYNYGIAMERDEYMRLFAFAPIDEIDRQEVLTQFYVVDKHRELMATNQYCNTMYYTMANRDFCRRTFGYNRIDDAIETDLNNTKEE